jgi:hypothetical protein
MNVCKINNNDPLHQPTERYDVFVAVLFTLQIRVIKWWIVTDILKGSGAFVSWVSSEAVWS